MSTTPYTVMQLREVPDRAPSLGIEALQEIRFPELDTQRTGLALMAVRPGRRPAVAHRHDEAEEVYVIVSGSGRIKLDDDVVEVGVLDAVRIAPHVVRAVEGGPDGIEYLAVGPRHAGDGETIAIEEFWPG